MIDLSFIVDDELHVFGSLHKYFISIKSEL